MRMPMRMRICHMLRITVVPAVIATVIRLSYLKLNTYKQTSGK